MPATKQDIRGWLTNNRGREREHTHMLVVCDTYDWDDFPVYTADPHKEYAERHGKNMQKVMEVYDLRADHEEQLAEHRAWRMPQKAQLG